MPALLAILEHLQPSTIFIELPAAVLPQYLNAYRSNLETTAVRRYCASKRVEVVPVDAPEVHNDFRDLLNTIERTSPHYRILLDQHTRETRSGGFVYLNSDRCADAWSAIYQEMRATVAWINDARVSADFEIWNRTHEYRDNEMLRNIVEYCARNSFVQGAFLVGAAHRRSIVAKALASDVSTSPNIDWDLQWHQELPA